MKSYLSILKKHCANTHYKLGVAYLRLGERQAALEQLRILKRLRPEMAERLNALIPKQA